MDGGYHRRAIKGAGMHRSAGGKSGANDPAADCGGPPGHDIRNREDKE